MLTSLCLFKIGDPPVSIVSYFALSRELLDGDNTENPAIETFIAMFKRYIDIPRNEEQYNKAWGITHSTSKNSQIRESRVVGKDKDSVDFHDGDTTFEGRSRLSSEDEELQLQQQQQQQHQQQHQNDIKKTPTSTSWLKMPSDITWPIGDYINEPGALPPGDFRNMRFKLLPSIIEGPWVVKAAVRSQPALLGRKVVQRYFRGNNIYLTNYLSIS
jgi:hypothetical protein